MRRIKFIVLFLAFMLGFILQCEVFQTELWNFDKSYYMTSAYNVPMEQMQGFLKDLSNTAEKYDVYVFSTFMSEQSNYEMLLNIYSDGDEVRQILARNNNIEECIYHSLFNGTTRISYHPFMDLYELENSYSNFVNYIGNTENIQKVYDDICQIYDVTPPDYLESTEKDMIVVVWLLMILLMLVMNCVDVIRRKKEVVVRISLGESVVRIILKSVVMDLLIDGIAYALARIFVFRFMSGEYQWKLAFCIFLLGSILSSCIYITFAFYDIRRAFSNVNDSKSVLFFMYGLKVAVTLVTVFTISANLSSLHANVLVKNEGRIISQYGDCFYFTLRDLSAMSYGLSGEDEKQRETIYSKAWKGIYESDYDKITPIICVNILDGDSEHILVNENAKYMLQGFKELFIEKAGDSDIVVFIPKRMDNNATRMDVSDDLESFVKTNEKPLNIQYIIYETNETFTYMSAQAVCGIKSTVNPIIIYQNNGEIQINGNKLVDFAGNEILYNISDETLKEIDEKYELSSHGFDLVRTNVQDFYNYRKSFVTRLVSFLSSLCVVVFLLQVILILTINALEYRLNALELSLKKILGYGLWTKNKKSIIFSVGVDLFAVFVLSMAGFFVDIFNIPLCILTGLIIAVVELFVVMWNIFLIEKGSVHKALKGGCL